MTLFDITYDDFKREDTTNVITITLYTDDKQPITPNASHTWKAKVSKEDKYVGEYPVTISGDTIKLSSSNLTRLPNGDYGLELWETYSGSTTIYPSAGVMEFRVHRNANDTMGTIDPTTDINGIIDDLHKAGQNIKVVATNTLPAGSKASVTQSITNGENQLTFYIPQGEKGEKGDPGAPGISGKDGLTPSIDNDTKHWMIGSTDTGVVAEGKDADAVFYKPGKMTNIYTGSPYDDLDTFPIGQTVTIAETPATIKQIKNLPPISNGAGGLTVRTDSSINDSIGAMQIAIDNKNVMYHRICWGASGAWGAWKSDNVYASSNDKILPTLSLFQKVGVVGDSYASGELAFDNNYVDHYEISWLQILARKDGFAGTNFSHGGLSTHTWLSDPKGLSLMKSSEAQDLYILALGINDVSFGLSYLGSEADIDTGVDSFYGNYGKIIKAIQTKAPQAKIVMATIAESSDSATQFNEAIKSIANHFAIPVIVQLDDPLFNSFFYKNNMVGGHPTGPVYAAMAAAFERLIGQSMIDHLDYYKTFKKDD